MSKDRFEELFQWFGRLVKELRSSRRQREDAEDVAQEALFETWKKIDTIGPGAEVSYVRRAIRNRDINQALRTRVGEPLEDRADEDSPSAEEQLVIAEFQKRFAAELTELPELTRLIVVLRSRGCGFDEIATKLRITSTAARSRFSRAAQHLRERLGAPPQGVKWLEIPGEDDDDHEE